MQVAPHTSGIEVRRWGHTESGEQKYIDVGIPDGHVIFRGPYLANFGVGFRLNHARARLAPHTSRIDEEGHFWYTESGEKVRIRTGSYSGGHVIFRGPYLANFGVGFRLNHARARLAPHTSQIDEEGHFWYTESGEQVRTSQTLEMVSGSTELARDWHPIQAEQKKYTAGATSTLVKASQQSEMQSSSSDVSAMDCNEFVQPGITETTPKSAPGELLTTSGPISIMSMLDQLSNRIKEPRMEWITREDGMLVCTLCTGKDHREYKERDALRKHCRASHPAKEGLGTNPRVHTEEFLRDAFEVAGLVRVS
ncbi:hypothetical protein BJ742DRAFT_776090 [Cladochytrium replicatum]|nr:hypothetical protein BJ742DRAFT_776090 [Cladochytrium replicatum]